MVGVVLVTHPHLGEEFIRSAEMICGKLPRVLTVSIDTRKEVEELRRGIAEALKKSADKFKADLILTTGGTGVSPRDVTPDATREVIEKEVPGFSEAMRAEGLKKTPHAMISRAIIGIRGSSLIVNLPGSPKSVRENLGVILPALPHALSKLKGDPTECGQG
jgi:molybdenum cofactor synthesis domain-containing protein